MNMNKKDADQKKAFIEGHLLEVLYAGRGRIRPARKKGKYREIYFKSQIKTPSDLTVVLR